MFTAFCRTLPSTHKALGAVGVDPRELTEAAEFFGTAALKSYNTFVRPRPKQLSKVGKDHYNYQYFYYCGCCYYYYYHY